MYQSGDRMLVIVLLGESGRHAKEFRNQLSSLHLENVKILTSKEYQEFLGFDGHHAKTFDLYQRLTFNVFSSKRLLYDAALQSNLVAKELRALN